MFQLVAILASYCSWLDWVLVKNRRVAWHWPPFPVKRNAHDIIPWNVSTPYPEKSTPSPREGEQQNQQKSANQHTPVAHKSGTPCKTPQPANQSTAYQPGNQSYQPGNQSTSQVTSLPAYQPGNQSTSLPARQPVYQPTSQEPSLPDRQPVYQTNVPSSVKTYLKITLNF